MPIETERKIIASDNVFNMYLKDLGTTKKLKCVDTYFCNQSLDFKKNSESLRIRDVVTEGISKITYKYLASSGPNLFIREEKEICLPPQTQKDIDILFDIFAILGIETNVKTLNRSKVEEILKINYEIIGTVVKNGYRFWKDNTKISLYATTFRNKAKVKTINTIEIEGSEYLIKKEYKKFLEIYGNMGSIRLSDKNNFQLLLSI